MHNARSRFALGVAILLASSIAPLHGVAAPNAITLKPVATGTPLPNSIKPLTVEGLKKQATVVDPLLINNAKKDLQGALQNQASLPSTRSSNSGHVAQSSNPLRARTADIPDQPTGGQAQQFAAQMDVTHAQTDLSNAQTYQQQDILIASHAQAYVDYENNFLRPNHQSLQSKDPIVLTLSTPTPAPDATAKAPQPSAQATSTPSGFDTTKFTGAQGDFTKLQGIQDPKITAALASPEPLGTPKAVSYSVGGNVLGGNVTLKPQLTATTAGTSVGETLSVNGEVIDKTLQIGSVSIILTSTGAPAKDRLQLTTVFNGQSNDFDSDLPSAPACAPTCDLVNPPILNKAVTGPTIPITGIPFLLNLDVGTGGVLTASVPYSYAVVSGGGAYLTITPHVAAAVKTDATFTVTSLFKGGFGAQVALVDLQMNGFIASTLVKKNDKVVGVLVGDGLDATNSTAAGTLDIEGQLVCGSICALFFPSGWKPFTYKIANWDGFNGSFNVVPNEWHYYAFTS